MEEERDRLRPLSVRESGDAEEYDALIPGVPTWLGTPLMAWVYHRLESPPSRSLHGQFSSTEGMLHTIQAELRCQLDWFNGLDSAFDSLEAKMQQSDEFFFDVVDNLVRDAPPSSAASLEKLLRGGGSAYRVEEYAEGPPIRFKLTTRVASEVRDRAMEVVKKSGKAGQLIKDAWFNLYGRNPNASEAYRDAVRAVEAAAAKVVIPDSPTPTLGTIISALRDGGARKYHFSIIPKEGVDPVEALTTMAKLLWKGQTDRHPDPSEEELKKVSDKEAEAALHLAITLVHWFSARLVQRIEAETRDLSKRSPAENP